MAKIKNKSNGSTNPLNPTSSRIPLGNPHKERLGLTSPNTKGIKAPATGPGPKFGSEKVSINQDPRMNHPKITT
jgi:hypothetical protein